MTLPASCGDFPEFKIQCGHRNFEPNYRLKVSWNLARWTFGLIIAAVKHGDKSTKKMFPAYKQPTFLGNLRG